MKAYKIINAQNCEIAILTEDELNEYMEDGTIRFDDRIVEVELEH